jgi:SNF2 family DNA or RNA helicase
MEFKTDSKLFSNLLEVLDVYNNIYDDAINSYINLHTVAAVDSTKNIIKTVQTKKPSARRRPNYYDNDGLTDSDDDDELIINQPNQQNQIAGANQVNQTNPVNPDELKKAKEKIELKKIEERNEKNYIINGVSNAILDQDYIGGYSCLNKIKTKLANFLIAQILDNSPEADVVKTKFSNLKTELYPYQINNLNWMLNIENKIYGEEYTDLTKKIYFRGGGLFDEVGMGKTLQIITLINMNKSKTNSLVHGDKIYSKATLIIVPNHLCGQWAREFQIHLKDQLRTINLLTKAHYKKYTYFDFTNADVVIVSANFFTNCKLNQHEEFDPLHNIINILDKDVNIFNIYWHRVVIDEFHEIEDSNLFLKLKFLESNYRWIISGTPFKQKEIDCYTEIDSTSLSSVIDYLSFGINNVNRINIFDKLSYNYIRNHFSRNTHNKNIKILKLPEIIEENIWLNFTETERMIYNAYLADPNNTVNDVFLRQLCCHPLISEKIRENISNKVESLEDIQKHIKKMYMADFDKADENYNVCLERIDRIKNDMKEMEKEGKTNLMGYSNLKEDLLVAQGKIGDLKKIRDGKEKTVIYYKTFIDLISDMKNITKQNCSICLDPIKEHDLGITFCGHIYCYSCISTIIKESRVSGMGSSCPDCNKSLSVDKIFLISENKSKEVNTLGTKLAYIIKYIKSTPNKYRIIFSQWDYLLKEVGKVLEQNGIKQLYCQGNVYQKDKVLRLFNSPDTDKNEYRIIMLSSESTVSGSNLNNAEEVIFLDPIYGDKQYRLNTENQAIGRVRRLGNKHKQIKVLRLFIKDSVEEDIFNANNK